MMIEGSILSLILLGVGFYIVGLNSPIITTHDSVISACSPAETCDSCISVTDCGYCFTVDSNLYNGSCISVNQTDSERSAVGPCSATDMDSFHWATNYCPTDYAWLIVLGLVLFLTFYPPGMGALPWVINTEIYPQWARSTGNACSVGVNWSVSLLTSISFLSLIKAITRPGVYYLYAGISAVGFLFFLGNLPETKGKSLEEVQALFAHPWCYECLPRTRENVVSPTDDLSE